MRQIKYRAWDRQDKRMIVDQEFTTPLKKVTNIGVLSRSDQATLVSGEKWVFLKWTRFKIMQWTGLRDRNGREIYEGDVLQKDITSEKLYVVKWSDNAMYVLMLNGATAGMICEYDMKEFEVVGNIFENPELLGGTNE